MIHTHKQSSPCPSIFCIKRQNSCWSAFRAFSVFYPRNGFFAHGRASRLSTSALPVLCVAVPYSYRVLLLKGKSMSHYCTARVSGARGAPRARAAPSAAHLLLRSLVEQAPTPPAPRRRSRPAPPSPRPPQFASEHQRCRTYVSSPSHDSLEHNRDE